MHTQCTEFFFSILICIVIFEFTSFSPHSELLGHILTMFFLSHTFTFACSRLKMDEFAFDLDKALDDLEESEGKILYTFE